MEAWSFDTFRPRCCSEFAGNHAVPLQARLRTGSFLRTFSTHFFCALQACSPSTSRSFRHVPPPGGQSPSDIFTKHFGGSVVGGKQPGSWRCSWRTSWNGLRCIFWMSSWRNSWRISLGNSWWSSRRVSGAVSGGAPVDLS